MLITPSRELIKPVPPKLLMPTVGRQQSRHLRSRHLGGPSNPPAAGGGGGGPSSFTMTAADVLGAAAGYTRAGIFNGQIGSISNEPISGETLAALISGALNLFRFDGDQTGVLGSLQVYVDSVSYAGSWSYDGSEFTDYTYSSTMPSFSVSGSYLIEIKA